MGAPPNTGNPGKAYNKHCESNLVLLLQEVVKENLTPLRSSLSLYSCLFIWELLDYRRHGNGSRTVYIFAKAIFNQFALKLRCKKIFLPLNNVRL